MGRAYRGVVGAMLLLHPVPAECVVIKPGVLKQSDPLLPARRHVRAVVLIEVFSKESWKGTEACERAADLALASLGELDQAECSQPETNTQPLVLGKRGAQGSFSAAFTCTR